MEKSLKWEKFFLKNSFTLNYSVGPSVLLQEFIKIDQILLESFFCQGMLFTSVKNR